MKNDFSKPYEGFNEVLFNQKKANTQSFSTSAATKIQIPMTWQTISL